MSERKVGLSAGRPSDKKKAATLAALADKRETVRVNFDLARDEHMHITPCGRTLGTSTLASGTSSRRG